jgi:hypothetical protein
LKSTAYSTWAAAYFLLALVAGLEVHGVAPDAIAGAFEILTPQGSPLAHDPLESSDERSQLNDPQ